MHAIVREQFETLRELSVDPDDAGSGLPDFVVHEFEAFLACGDPSRGFARLGCKRCGLERLLPFSCKTRTLCPSCSSRRMFQTAAFLVDHVLPTTPLRQWVLSPPFPLVALLGARDDILSAMNRAFVSGVLKWIERRGPEGGRSGAVAFTQRFSSSLLLFPHFHVVALDGVFVEDGGRVLVDHAQGSSAPCPR